MQKKNIDYQESDKTHFIFQWNSTYDEEISLITVNYVLKSDKNKNSNKFLYNIKVEKYLKDYKDPIITISYKMKDRLTVIHFLQMFQMEMDKIKSCYVRLISPINENNEYFNLLNFNVPSEKILEPYSKNNANFLNNLLKMQSKLNLTQIIELEENSSDEDD